MGLFSAFTVPPTCPKCGKRMKKRANMSISAFFTETFQPERFQDYICDNYVSNPEYAKWNASKNVGQRPPELIPCENHYNKEYDRVTKKIKPRLRKQYFQKNFMGKVVKAKTGFRTSKNE